MRRSALVGILLVQFAVSAVCAETIAIVGGKLHTVGPLGIVENSTILVEDGLIRTIGLNLPVPEGATVIDAKGKFVTPGLFVVGASYGLGEIGLSADPVDSGQRGDRFTAGFDVADAFNRRATIIAADRIDGITRALIVPKPVNLLNVKPDSHVISGLGAVINLGGGADSIDRHAAAMVVNLGASGSTFAGGSRAGAWLLLRDALDEARRYRRNPEGFEAGELEHSERDLQALVRVLDRRTPLLVGMHRASDIEVLLRFVREYRVRAVISGGAEAWMLADELAAADVPVLINPLDILPGDFDRLNARRGSATILAAAGVKVALLASGTPSQSRRNITQLAGNAVADGMTWSDALRAITLTPAEIFGMAGSVGSIEPGKQADIVIWPGDPFELTNYPDAVFIGGRAVDMVSRQTLLRDRYLQHESQVPPAFRKH